MTSSGVVIITTQLPAHAPATTSCDRGIVKQSKGTEDGQPRGKRRGFLALVKLQCCCFVDSWDDGQVCFLGRRMQQQQRTKAANVSNVNV